jgi:hypothetical protein
MGRDALSWHVVVDCKLVKVPVFSKVVIISSLLGLFFLLLEVANETCFITAKLIEFRFYSRLDKVHELRKHSNIFFGFNVIGPVLEFISVVLNTPFEHLHPFSSVQISYYVCLLLLSDEVREYIKSRNRVSSGHSRVWEVDQVNFLYVSFLQQRVKEHNHSSFILPFFHLV